MSVLDSFINYVTRTRGTQRNERIKSHPAGIFAIWPRHAHFQSILALCHAQFCPFANRVTLEISSDLHHALLTRDAIDECLTLIFHSLSHDAELSGLTYGQRSIVKKETTHAENQHRHGSIESSSPDAPPYVCVADIRGGRVSPTRIMVRKQSSEGFG